MKRSLAKRGKSEISIHSPFDQLKYDLHLEIDRKLSRRLRHERLLDFQDRFVASESFAIRYADGEFDSLFLRPVLSRGRQLESPPGGSVKLLPRHRRILVAKAKEQCIQTLLWGPSRVRLGNHNNARSFWKRYLTMRIVEVPEGLTI